jgi:tRNA pseudouridine38-40 synthase
MPRYLIQIRYDGTNFSGWQKQPGQTKTIQGEAERVLSLILREPVELVGSGRTDAGVHAECQFAHFDFSCSITDCDDLRSRINKLMHKSVYADAITEVTQEFHARFDATRRAYRYQLSAGRDVFNDRYSWIVGDSLDTGKMQSVSQKLIGIHDFASFSKYNPEQFGTLCTVYRSDFVVIGDGRYLYEIEANRFLHHMVRAICGALVAIGRGKEPESFIEDGLANPRHDMFKYIAPPHALFLHKVTYE